MNYTKAKQTAQTLQDIGVIDWKEAIRQMNDGDSDFYIGDFRFIADHAIDAIQQDELESDSYILGCFASWLLADVLGISTESVEKIQQASPEALGEMVIAQGKVAAVQYAYSSADGYGHHFAHYDGNEHCFDGYTAFRTN